MSELPDQLFNLERYVYKKAYVDDIGFNTKRMWYWTTKYAVINMLVGFWEDLTIEWLEKKLQAQRGSLVFLIGSKSLYEGEKREAFKKTLENEQIPVTAAVAKSYLDVLRIKRKERK